MKKENRDKIRISFGSIVRYKIANTKEWITEIEYLQKKGLL